MSRLSQKGIAHIGLLLLVAVAAVIVFAGYKLEQSHAKDNKGNNLASTSVNTAQNSPQVPVINTKADLNTAETVLNNENIDGDLNPANYNQDVSSLQ